jgi:hypothetical protein
LHFIYIFIHQKSLQMSTATWKLIAEAIETELETSNAAAAAAATAAATSSVKKVS